MKTVKKTGGFLHLLTNRQKRRFLPKSTQQDIYTPMTFFEEDINLKKTFT
jgi:hypothetical protein